MERQMDEQIEIDRWRGGDTDVEQIRDGQMERRRDEQTEMERWRDGETERWTDKGMNRLRHGETEV